MIVEAAAAAEVVARHVAERVPNLRAKVGQWVRKPARTTESVSVDELMGALGALGLRRDTDLIVHSSWAGMPQLKVMPSAILRAFREVVGTNGTLAMPAHPVEKHKDGRLFFDVATTPSRMGMLSETLRRTPGARRAPCPIAPVAALGPAADAYTRDHREASGRTPWGRGSAWWELGERDGQEIILGIDFVRSLTLLHCAFDVLGEENPIADYYEDVDTIVVWNGVEELWPMRQQRRELEKHLATYAFRQMVLASGTARTTSLRGIPLTVVDARPFLAWHLRLARETGLPYWGFRRRGKG